MPRLEEMFGLPDAPVPTAAAAILIDGTRYEIKDGLVQKVGAAIIQVPMPLKKELFFPK